MDPLALFLSASGRLPPRPFWIAVVVIYAAGFFSQALLAPAVLARSGVWAFALVQAALVWMWLAVHAKRLRDADRGIGAAVGVAIVAALAVALFILVIAVFHQAASVDPDATANFIGLVAIYYVVAVFSGASDFGALGTVLAVFVIMVFTPLVLALGLSLWAGTRRGVPASPPAAAPAAGA
jgi:uncharacterized membrane protein YhaH (DUF805 family)